MGNIREILDNLQNGELSHQFSSEQQGAIEIALESLNSSLPIDIDRLPLTTHEDIEVLHEYNQNI